MNLTHYMYYEGVHYDSFRCAEKQCDFLARRSRSCILPNKTVHSGKKVKIHERAYARLLGSRE